MVKFVKGSALWGIQLIWAITSYTEYNLELREESWNSEVFNAYKSFGLSHHTEHNFGLGYSNTVNDEGQLYQKHTQVMHSLCIIYLSLLFDQYSNWQITSSATFLIWSVVICSVFHGCESCVFHGCERLWAIGRTTLSKCTKYLLTYQTSKSSTWICRVIQSPAAGLFWAVRYYGIDHNVVLGKSFCKTSFHLGMAWKKYRTRQKWKNTSMQNALHQ